MLLELPIIRAVNPHSVRAVAAMRCMQGKRALITGAAGGIGRAIARRLAAEGVQLALLDNNAAALETMDDPALAGAGKPLRLVCDLADPQQIAAAVLRLEQAWGGVEILVNNAGVVYYGKTHEMTAAESQRLMQVNLCGAIELTRRLLPDMLSAEEAHVVNICSMYGYFTTNASTLYHASKFGLLGFSEALRAECARESLNVSAICPGFVETGLFDSMLEHHGRRKRPPGWICTTADRVASQTVSAIRGNRRVLLTGWLAHATHAIRRLAPGLIDRLYHLRRPRALKRAKQAEAKPLDRAA